MEAATVERVGDALPAWLNIVVCVDCPGLNRLLASKNAVEATELSTPEEPPPPGDCIDSVFAGDDAAIFSSCDPHAGAASRDARLSLKLASKSRGSDVCESASENSSSISARASSTMAASRFGDDGATTDVACLGDDDASTVTGFVAAPMSERSADKPAASA